MGAEGHKRPVHQKDLVSLRLVLHWAADGQVVASVMTRTWRGAESWNVRVAPSAPLGRPPLPPPGSDPHVHYLHWAAAELEELHYTRPATQSPRRPPEGDHRGRLPRSGDTETP